MLDNQWIDSASYNKTKHLIDAGASVFIWPSELNRFKDFNDICSHLGEDEISESFIHKNMYSSISAHLMFSKIK